MEKKFITEQEMAEYLRNNVSVEWEEYYKSSAYYAHVKDGALYGYCNGADESFFTLFDFDDFEIPEDERDVEMGLDCIYSRETMENPGFARVVRNLTAQVNAYLAESSDDDEDGEEDNDEE